MKSVTPSTIKYPNTLLPPRKISIWIYIPTYVNKKNLGLVKQEYENTLDKVGHTLNTIKPCFSPREAIA